MLELALLHFPSIERFTKRHYLHNSQDFWGIFPGRFGWGLGLFYKGGGYQEGGIILRGGQNPSAYYGPKQDYNN